VFLQPGGSKLKDMVDAGLVADITDAIDAPNIPEGAFAAHSLGGKRYAMPMTILPGGMFYSKDLFAQAGITAEPKTMAEFTDAIAKLKAANITPIALGAQAGWPAAYWFYWFALRMCTPGALEAAANNANLSDPCFRAAGEQLTALADTKPFNDGFLTTDPQQGAGSSAGLIANHQAAMELMGAWAPGQIGSLTPDGKPLSDLGFFAFPTVAGGAGDPSAVLADVDAFSCSSTAPEPTCTNFLNYLASTDIQTEFANQTGAPPASTTAAVTDPVLQTVMGSANNAAYVSLRLDARFGPSIDTALSNAVVDLLAGNGTVQGLIDAANAVAGQG
jgi:raffinose/stachyose/melibiose transport system substrate-binding protein